MKKTEMFVRGGIYSFIIIDEFLVRSCLCLQLVFPSYWHHNTFFLFFVSMPLSRSPSFTFITDPFICVVIFMTLKQNLQGFCVL